MALTGVGGSNVAPILHAQAPVGAGFQLNAGDLRFIFHQIEIAQAHSAGGTLLGPGPNQIADLGFPFGLRTVDGTFNHLEADKTTFGASDQVFQRMTTPVFRPGYTSTGGSVTDASPRMISNLIADQTVRNLAAVAVADGATPEPLGTLPIPNTATDVGLSAPFNSMFTFFGQFFDHGLDLVNKGGAGTVFVPLLADDPLVTHGPDGDAATTADNVPVGTPMMLTRASRAPGSTEGINQTTPFVDQNQTYTSHPSHQAFLREYALVGGVPRATGRLIDGVGGNIGNWAEVKQQASTMLGITLVDADVSNVPLLVTDAYGYLRRDLATGQPMAVPAGGGPFIVLNPAAPIASSLIAKTNHEFLNDIAHSAAPTAGGPDTDLTIGSSLDATVPAGSYDNELLDVHFVTGDGRGNENIALTAVHSVFHSEHNRLQANIDSLINSPAFGLSPAEVLAWQTPDAASGWDYGERLFQAARFVTEMEYQHLVFEEFARKLVPSINPFIGDGINFQSATNPAIFAEFAHQTYRLGHSMLNETIARTAPDGTNYDVPLLDAFLNPLEFNRGPGGTTLTAGQAAGAIFQGGTRQVANEIDEFVTEAVRNRLVGLPLDLAVLNLARGRSEGVAPLNEVRRQLFNATGDSAVVPYADWFDFSFAIRHPESLVNFVAAYGRHATLTDPPAPAAPLTAAERRAAASVLVNDFTFMFQSAATSGLDEVDLWMGGLAEKINPFGPMLGSTFTFVFELQLENLQNADRFYYLERLDGLNLLAQLEANSFAELISRNTSLVGPPADIFSRPDLIFNLSAQNLSGPIVDDPATGEYDERFELVRMPNGTIRYAGPAHVIFNGRNDANPDRVISSEGDDTLRGDGGNDVMEGGSGNDQMVGGEGDDILTDNFGDDVMKGGPGHDAISGGAGTFDLLQGNEGDDYIIAGNDFSEIFGGGGDDVFFTGEAGTEAFGGAGDDWIEGGPQLNLLVGDENNQFQNDPNGGHDVIIGGKGDNDFDSEGGDDVMVAGVRGTQRFEGMLGFDWVTYRGADLPVDADMSVNIVLLPLDELRDRFDLSEALSGFNLNDLLYGTNRIDTDMVGNELTLAGINRVSGLSAFLNGATSFTGGDIILGGAGSDRIEGRGGNDLIDGDAWFNVQLRAPNLATPDPTDTKLVDTLQALKPEVFAGLINPGTIDIFRSITTLGASPADIDTAVFTGPQANYTIQIAGNRVIVTDTVGLDGVDTLRNIERLQFADGTINSPVGSAGVTVSSVLGQTLASATAELAALGLGVSATFANSPTVASGLVISQSTPAGQLATAGSTIALVVSLGPPTVLVPNVVGATQGGATAALTAAGLTTTTTTAVSEVPAGNVISQTPVAGASAIVGSNVALVISGGSSAGLVAAFGFEEAAGNVVVDTSLLPRNGTISGAVRVASNIAQKIGNALRFDGINDWVTITDVTASKLDLTNGMTIEAWVNPSALTDSRTIVMKERGTSLSYMLYANDDVLNSNPVGNIFAGAAIRSVVPAPLVALPLNTWTHVATTYNGANQELYINGVLVGSRAQTGNMAVGNGALRIGGNNPFGGEFFQGLIDEVRVYNRALTAAEIVIDMTKPVVFGTPVVP